MTRIEVEQLGRSRTAPAASEAAFDFIEADLPAKLLGDLQRDESREVATLRLATPCE